ncbi:MAG: ParB N-terminal domain-containing protein [Bacteroidales bacterium]|nr:ParB N-terminal domain-containing protein [Bacteroidales bacterium]
MNLKEIKTVKTSTLEANRGQIEGLPKNPRKWSSDDVDVLARSIEETPELMMARPLIVVPKGKKHVVLGGNMRLEAVRRLGWKECPCFVFKGLTEEKMKEIVLKDNSSFGDWDTDELANQWDDLPLSEWGVNVAGAESAGPSTGNKEIDTDDWSEDMTLKLKFTGEEMAEVTAYFAGKDPRVELLKLVGYGE